MLNKNRFLIFPKISKEYNADATYRVCYAAKIHFTMSFLYIKINGRVRAELIFNICL